MTATHVVRGVSSIENWLAYEPSAACARSSVSCMNFSGLRRIGFASCWNRSMNRRTAICAAMSAPTWPPIPSAMTSSSASRLYVYAVRSWLTSRAPLRDSWNIVKRMMRVRALDADLREEKALEVPEERQLAFVRRDVANRALQCEDALRTLERIEPQAPVDDLQQVVRILARPDLLGGDQMIFRQPRIGRLRRKGGEAREHR